MPSTIKNPSGAAMFRAMMPRRVSLMSSLAIMPVSQLVSVILVRHVKYPITVRALDAQSEPHAVTSSSSLAISSIADMIA